jgi:hypothetical protein
MLVTPRYAHLRGGTYTYTRSPPFVAVVAHLARYHLDRHANFDRLVSNVGQLRGDNRTLFQLYQGNCTRCVRLIAGGTLINRGVRIYFSLSTESVQILGFSTAVRAHITWREDFMIAMWTNFTHQRISLFP